MQPKSSQKCVYKFYTFIYFWNKTKEKHLKLNRWLIRGNINYYANLNNTVKINLELSTIIIIHATTCITLFAIQCCVSVILVVINITLGLIKTKINAY